MYDSNYTTFWKRQNCGDSKKISGCQGLGSREGCIGGSQRNFKAVNYSVLTIEVQIHRMYTPE